MLYKITIQTFEVDLNYLKITRQVYLDCLDKVNNNIIDFYPI
jgi:hypothetical protein